MEISCRSLTFSFDLVRTSFILLMTPILVIASVIVPGESFNAANKTCSSGFQIRLSTMRVDQLPIVSAGKNCCSRESKWVPLFPESIRRRSTVWSNSVLDVGVSGKFSFS